MEYRSGDAEEESPDEDGIEYFENIYWCAFLLFIIGEVNDVPLLWKAKNLNMDVAIGMDWQFLVGAGIDETVQFASANKMDDLADYLRDYQSDPPSLVGWAAYRSYYFYGGRTPHD